MPLLIIAAIVLSAFLPADAAAPPDPEPIKTQRPLAYVWEYEDPWTEQKGVAAKQLAEAGFRVRPLPMDKSPFELLDAHLIFMGSFVTEDPAYRAYMKKYADDLYHFVDKGRLLVQMTQADQAEAGPPFLPTTQSATRSDSDFAKAVIVSPKHPVVAGLAGKHKQLQLDETSTIWEAFSDYGGFEVILASDADAEHAAMMEGAYGQGRILLCAMAFDKGTSRKSGPDGKHAQARASFARQFFASLLPHAQATVQRKTTPLKPTVSPSRANRFVEGSWTLAVLPDTQVYSLRTPGLFLTQTSWLAQQSEAIDLKYVLHLGDIVNNNTDKEWTNAANAMSLLDGVVPYALVPGNHDYGPSGDASTRDTLLNEYFTVEKAEQWSTFGGVMEAGKLDNSYHLFEAGGKKWIIVCLEWGPRDSTLGWANKVMEQHPDRLGILNTHAYLNNNDRRYDHTDRKHPQHYNPHEYRTPGGVNDGEEVWQKLVRKHNFLLTLNGHVLGDGTGYRADKNDKGKTCHQMLINYQMRSLGGEAYMRLLEFRPDGKTLRVKAYSPLYDKYLTEDDHSFTLDLDE